MRVFCSPKQSKSEGRKTNARRSGERLIGISRGRLQTVGPSRDEDTNANDPDKSGSVGAGLRHSFHPSDAVRRLHAF